MPLSIGQTFLSSVRACRDAFERSLKPSLAAVIVWQVDWQLRDQIHSAVNYKLGNVSPCGFAELSFLRRLFLSLPFVAHSSSQGFRSKKRWILKLGSFTHTFNHRTSINFNFALWPQKTNQFIVDSEAMCVSNVINFHPGVPEMSSMGRMDGGTTDRWTGGQPENMTSLWTGASHLSEMLWEFTFS